MTCKIDAPATCGLCGSQAVPFFYDDRKQQSYLHCSVCDLRFLSSASHLSAVEEAAYYQLHQNNVNDPHYRAFVRPLFEQIIQRATPGRLGLDFGCGPGPVVAAMLAERGFSVRLYDPVFFPDSSTLKGKYDFVICSEVAEHLRDPGAEIRRLQTLLKPDGFIAVMTGLFTQAIDFANWHYRRDPTHVCFYSAQTFAWITETIGFSSCWSDGRRVVILNN